MELKTMLWLGAGQLIQLHFANNDCVHFSNATARFGNHVNRNRLAVFDNPGEIRVLNP